MSLLNKASLIQIPSGYKDGTLYSAKPTNGDGDFTFSRGSNLAATRVNSEGLIEKGRENLLLRSNTFSSWSFTSGSSVTGNQAGYDGTNDAWLLTDSGTSGAYSMYRNFTDTGVLTASIYAKAASTDEIEIDFYGNIFPVVRVDLSDGSIIGGSSRIDATTEDVGNGWYRVTLTGNLSSLIYLRIGCNGAGTIYIQDAQVEQGLVATDYIETTTTTAQAGILEDMPRLDYSGGASCPSLLLEPQRSNSYTNSEYFDDWLSNRLDRTANNIISPEGVQNAYKMAQQSGFTTAPNINKGEIAAGTYTVSIFAKKGSWNYLAISFQGVSYFNLETGSKGTINSNHTATIEDYGNGWYRCAITRTTTTTQTPAFYFAESDNTLTTPDTQGYMYTFGAMLEAGGYPTSYIPTYGSSVTRAFDNAGTRTDMQDFLGTDTGAWLMHLDQFYFDITGTGLGSIILAENGQQATSIELVQDGNFQYKVTLNNSTAVENLDGEDKLLMNWSSDFFKIFLNGVNVYNSSSSQFSHAFTHLFLPQTTRAPHIKIKQMLFFSTALTDAECIELTTI